MDLYAELERLISSQDPTSAPPAEILAKIGSPSVSIAVLDHGSITSKCLSTIRDDSETLFQACSISKPIAGMAIMRLVQAGKLHLDSKIVDLLPKDIVSNLETPHTKSLIQQITVRQLMSHTSGLTVAGVPGYAPSRDLPDAKAMLSGKPPANTLQVRAQTLPGYVFSYSGGGMIVLQVILETVTGKDFPTLVKDLVLEPLEMSRSYYVLADGEKNVTRAHFTGYTPCDVQSHFFPEMAAAGLWTTPTDLLKAVRAMQRSFKSNDGESFLEQNIAREMLEQVQDTMGLTWVAPKDPGIGLSHSGSNFPGWQCFLVGFADLGNGEKNEGMSKQNVPDECGISIMTNSLSGLAVWAKVLHAISFLKKWPSLLSIDTRALFGKTPFCVYGTPVNKQWAEWKGSWLESGKELILDARRDGEPVLRFGTDMESRLVTAAIPGVEYAGKGESIDLVVEGLEMMLRLGWKDGKRDIELWCDGMPPTATHLERNDEGESH